MRVGIRGFLFALAVVALISGEARADWLITGFAGANLGGSTGDKKGDYGAWHRYTTDQIEDNGQHEVLNWFCLLGAMEELGRKPDRATFIETWAFVSPAVFAYYPP